MYDMLWVDHLAGKIYPARALRALGLLLADGAPTVDSMDNKEEKTREVADIRIYYIA